MPFLISHTLDSGTLLEGVHASDGASKLLSRHGWRWSRAINAWHLPYSRMKPSFRSAIDATALQLRARGFQVEIDIDDSSVPLPDASNRSRSAARITHRQPRADAPLVSPYWPHAAI